MFKVGERVKCVNAGNFSFNPRSNIINGNTYIVIVCSQGTKSEFITIYGEHHEEKYLALRFVSLRDIRKEKLEKLNSL